MIEHIDILELTIMQKREEYYYLVKNGFTACFRPSSFRDGGFGIDCVLHIKQNNQLKRIIGFAIKEKKVSVKSAFNYETKQKIQLDFATLFDFLQDFSFATIEQEKAIKKQENFERRQAKKARELIKT